MVRSPHASVALAIGVMLGASTVASAQSPPSPASPDSPLQASQRISLDLKGVDILDVLKLLSQKSGLNFIAGRNLSGRVTIFVNEVDVWEAFELIIDANDLAYERHGSIVTVMMARDYELMYGEKFQVRTRNAVWPLKHARGIQVAAVLNQLKSTIGRVVVDEATNTLVLSDIPSRLNEMQQLLKELDRPTESRVYTLNYTEADKLKEKIQELLSPIGAFTFDARTNKAVITDLPEILQKTDQVVRAFDIPDGEVLIEAKIVKVALTDEMDLGVDWKRVFGGIDLSVGSNFRVLGEAASGAQGFKYVTSTGNAQVIIDALKKITKTETLSNPRIMVSNNQEAKILVGKKEAIVTTTTTVPATGSTVASPSIQYVDVGTKLYVTPSVKRDGHIQMKVRPEVSTADIETFQSNRIPIVTSTEAETNVLVESGATLIIGGLIESKDAKTDNRLPFFGDLPVIGRTFRGTTHKKEKTELVLFLTPQIVKPDGSLFVAEPQEGGGAPDPSIPHVELHDPVPDAYRQAVRRRLEAYLISQFRAASLSGGSAVVSFVLSRSGQILGRQEIASPQGEPFILAAREALKQAQPFPPFPQGADADEVRFRLAVEYTP